MFKFKQKSLEMSCASKSCRDKYGFLSTIVCQRRVADDCFVSCILSHVLWSDSYISVLLFKLNVANDF